MAPPAGWREYADPETGDPWWTDDKGNFYEPSAAEFAGGGGTGSQQARGNPWQEAQAQLMALMNAGSRIPRMNISGPSIPTVGGMAQLDPYLQALQQEYNRLRLRLVDQPLARLQRQQAQFGAGRDILAQQAQQAALTGYYSDWGNPWERARLEVGRWFV